PRRARPARLSCARPRVRVRGDRSASRAAAHAAAARGHDRARSPPPREAAQRLARTTGRPGPGARARRTEDPQMIRDASIICFARRAGLERPILWTFLSNTAGLVGRLGESRVIYHAVDEYAAFAGVPREAFRRMEDALVRRADLVLTSSDSLQRERQRL